MKLLGRLARHRPDLSSTLAEFPVPVLVSILLFAYAQLDIAGLVADGTGSGEPVYRAGAAGFLAGGAAHYFGRGRRWALHQASGLALASAMAAGGLAYFTRIAQTSHAFLFAGLLSLLTIAAFLRPGARQGALWLFDLRLGIAALIASVAGIVFAAGVTAILASIGFLFELEPSEAWYSRIWASAMTLVSPIYGLALAPRDLEEEVVIEPGRDPLVARGVSVLVNFVLVPVVVVYALVLHAYALKILIDGAIPKNQIASMVTLFAAAGSATWLVAWPWRESGTPLLRRFVEGWFWLTVVPVVLLAVSIAQRVAEYGITPDRYGIILVAIWLMVIAAHLALRRRRADMRVLLGTFSALAFVGAFGPFGARGVTALDQLARLVGILEGQGALDAEGRFVPPADPFDLDTQSRLGSILVTLEEAGRLDRVRPLLSGRVDDPFVAGARESVSARAVAARMEVDLDLWKPGSARAYFAYSATEPWIEAFSTSGRLIGPISIGENRPWNGPDGFGAEIEQATVVVTIAGRRAVIPEAEIRALAEEADSSAHPPAVIALDPEARAILVQVSGQRAEDVRLATVVLWLVVRDGAATGS